MIKIICVGKVKEKYLRDAISDYEKRISKYYKIDIIEVNDSNMKEEAIKIKQHIKSNDYVITLEIEGNMLTSIELANKIDSIFQNNSNITFIIGGSYGLHDDIKKRVLEAFIETTKIALRGRTKKFQYILPDYSTKILEVDGEEFAECDYGLVVDNSNGSQELS